MFKDRPLQSRIDSPQDTVPAPRSIAPGSARRRRLISISSPLSGSCAAAASVSPRCTRTWTPTTPGDRLVFHVFAALAEFIIRELIVAGTCEALAAARARGRAGGRPSVVTPEILRAARDTLPNPTPTHASPPSPGCSASALAPSTTTPDRRELRRPPGPAATDRCAGPCPATAPVT